MTVETLAAAVLLTLIQTLPPDRTAALHAQQYPQTAESADDRAARYVAIARDVADVSIEVLGVEQAPRGAALLVAVAVRESRLDPDVDAQRCAPSRVALPGANCDGGRAGTLWQLHRSPETREQAARRALRGMLGSLRRCAALPADERLGGWFMGRGCEDAEGRRASRDRERLAALLEQKLRSALR